MDAGRDVQIVGNTIITANTQTSAVMVDNNFRGPSNITVCGNRLIGGGYTIYIDGLFEEGAIIDASIKMINSQVGGVFYGDYAFFDHRPVFYGNTRLDTLDADIKTGSNPKSRSSFASTAKHSKSFTRRMLSRPSYTHSLRDRNWHDRPATRHEVEPHSGGHLNDGGRLVAAAEEAIIASTTEGKDKRIYG